MLGAYPAELFIIITIKQISGLEMKTASPTSEMKKAALDGFKVQLDYWLGNADLSDRTYSELEIQVPFRTWIIEVYKCSTETYGVYSRSSVDIEETCHWIEDITIDDLGEDLTKEEAYSSAMRLCEKYVSDL